MKDRVISVTRMVVGGIFAILTLLCSVNVVIATQQVSAISVTGSTGEIEILDAGVDGLSISPNMVFHKTGDSITYRVALSNPDLRKYRIANVVDNNTDEYIKISYDYDKSMSSMDKAVYITIKYDKYIEFGEPFEMNDINITITIEEEVIPVVDPTGGNVPTDSTEVRIPNTGAVSKFLDYSQAKKDIALWIVLGLISLSVLVIMFVSRGNIIRFGVVVITVATFMFSFITAKTADAESQNIEIKFSGANISVLPDTTDPGNSVTVTFPNIYYKSSLYGNSYFIKTLDGKYVMFDTGMDDEGVREVIYNALKESQGGDKVTIDYLILSHLDEDHQGNVLAFFNDSNFTFKNIVLKRETWTNTRINQFNTIASNARAKGMNVYSNYSTTQEGFIRMNDGYSLQIGKYLVLTFFNVDNVYEGKTCTSGKVIGWTASTSPSDKFQTSDGKYVYFDGKNYPDIELKTTDTLTQKTQDWSTGVGVGMNRYFYATTGNGYSCASNAEAFGILAEVKVVGKSKYMYLPGDLENSGYDSLFNSGSNSPQIFRDLTFENGEFKTDITPYRIPSEKTTAVKIRNKLINDSASTNDIVIYQETHHGINNDVEAINTLGMNRASGIYAIQEGSPDRTNVTDYRTTKSYYYTLGKIPADRKLRVGTSGKSGVLCTINIVGETTCNLQ